MPALQHKERLSANLSIGVQVGPHTRGVGYKDKAGNITKVGRGVWTAEIKFAGERPIYRTTKIKYEPDSSYSKEQAIKIAYEIFSTFADRYGRGLEVSTVNYVTRLLDEYLKEAEENTAVNESLIAKGLEPLHVMYGGRNPWRDRNYSETESRLRLYLYPFCKQQLPTMGREPIARIENVKKRDWDALDQWLLRNNPRMSIESRLKIITEARRFLHWAYKREYIDDVPSIARPHRGGVTGARQRMRKEITPDTYKKIIRYTRDQYLDKDRSQFHRDYSYIFHLWILIMANTGIRCPTGSVEHTMVKWEHVNLPKNNKDTATMLRPDEKGHSYEAIIMPRAVEYIKALKDFYTKKKIPVSKGYMFRHPHNTYYGKSNPKYGQKKIAKGDPIKSFRTQWNNMAKKLDLHDFGTQEARVAQSERISPTSLRAWFITQRLYSDENIKIELLARCTGTSIGQIEARYLRLDMDKSYQYLTAGAYDDEGAEIVTVDGYYAGAETSEYWQNR